MSDTITTTLTTGITLANKNPPLTITSTGGITAPGNAITTPGAGYPNYILNAGNIIAGSQSAGIVTPLVTTIVNIGTITAGTGIAAGLYGAGQFSVINSGTIIGTIAGIAGNLGGVVDNSGDIYSVVTAINADSVINTGTITSLGDGIITHDGTNSGYISAGQAGIHTNDIFTNSGTIISNDIGAEYGVRFENQGYIKGTTIGVKCGVSLENVGTIIGATAVVGSGIINNGNQGFIGGGIGIDLTANGILSNAGSIIGTTYGLELYTDVGASATNTGYIGSSYIGAVLESVSDVTKPRNFLTNSGYIWGKSAGVGIQYGDMTNTGKITSSTIGLAMAAGTVTNTGQIKGDKYGVFLNSTISNRYALVKNTGNISGSVAGVVIYAMDTINNSGLITGSTFGIAADEGTIIDSGQISGGTDAIYAVGSLDIIINPGAVFNGNVVDKSGAGTIILAGNSGGSLNLSDPFTGFSNISFSAGANWHLIGTSAEIAGGETISGFTLGDHIELTNFTPTSSRLVAGTHLVLSNGKTSETLDLAGNHSAAFAVSNGVVAALCFASATKLQTPNGKRRIEDLQIGEKILTLDGAEQEIKWIGRRSYDGRFIENNHLALPVTIKAHALAKNMPSRDLTVSPGHGIFISGHLIPAWRLINGVTITQAAQVDQIEYFHIELATHSVILAENCPAESFLDIGLRHQFHNAAEYTDTETTRTALPRLEDGFLLQTIQRRLEHRAGIKILPEPTGPLRGCVDEASAATIRGWANCAGAPDTPISLDIFVDGARHATILANAYRPDLRAAGLGSGCHGFALPGVPGRIDIRRSLDATPLPHAPHACAA